MAAPLTRRRRESGGRHPEVEALGRVVQTLLDGPVRESRGLARLAVRRALSRLLDACESLGRRRAREEARGHLESALDWLELAEDSTRRKERGSALGACRARIAVLLRRLS